METTIRGILEKQIDYVTDPTKLGQIAVGFQAIFPIKSMEDCLFGYVVGNMLGNYTSLLTSMGRTKLTDNEIEEFWNIIKRRTMEIKGKIKLALSK